MRLQDHISKRPNIKMHLVKLNDNLVTFIESSEKTPWLAYSDSLNEMFYNAGKKIKSSMSGKDKKQESPKLVINSGGLKSMFIDCAPWTIVKK